MTMGERRDKDAIVDQLMAKGTQKYLIAAHCVQCTYDPYDGGSYRSQIERCGVPSCSLYSVRPKPIKTGKNGGLSCSPLVTLLSVMNPPETPQTASGSLERYLAQFPELANTAQRDELDS